MQSSINKPGNAWKCRDARGFHWLKQAKPNQFTTTLLLIKNKPESFKADQYLGTHLKYM